jgi:hypothetical protein
MVTIIFMQSVMEIALPVKKLSSKNWSNLSGVGRFSVTNFKLPRSLHFFENHPHTMNDKCHFQGFFLIAVHFL